MVWFDNYGNDFKTFEKFVEWYNTIGYHQSSDTNNYLKKREDEFWTRLSEEFKLGIFCTCGSEKNEEQKV